MLDHIGFAVSDIAASRAFYEAALAPLAAVAASLADIQGILGRSQPSVVA